jgi:hypothetical protein
MNPVRMVKAIAARNQLLITNAGLLIFGPADNA